MGGGMKLLQGGEGSGNFGHSGRPGEVGGSSEGYSEMSRGEFVTLSDKYSIAEKYKNSMEGFDKDMAIGVYLGTAYRQINSSLRDGYYPKNTNFLKAAQALDELTQFGQAERNIVLFRGVNSYWNLNVGDEFIDKAFVSTTISRQGAATFKDTIQQIFVIKVPKGSRMGYPGVTSENEIILPRNSKFRVSRISEDWGITNGSPPRPLKIVEVDLIS